MKLTKMTKRELSEEFFRVHQHFLEVTRGGLFHYIDDAIYKDVKKKLNEVLFELDRRRKEDVA